MINDIRKLRIIALLLFLIPSVSLVGSLILHNYLSEFHFKHTIDYGFQDNSSGSKIKILCDETNNFCSEINYEFFSKLNQCYKNKKIETFIYDNDNEVNFINFDTRFEEIKNSNDVIFLEHQLADIIDDKCILNTESIKFYNIFPIFYETVSKIKYNEKTVLGTKGKVNPFFYGETSISNIVKRHPVKFFFKPLIYLGVFLMLLYWIYYNKILKNSFNTKKNFLFAIFGLLSALFLFLHVFFLGWTFESDFLNKLRRTFIIFFILFEVLAQGFLINKLYLIRNVLTKYLNLTIIYIKILFVAMVCLSSMIILTILVFYNLDSKVDYIIEWNYFLILLVFYFLSFLVWKKLNSNPTTA